MNRRGAARSRPSLAVSFSLMALLPVLAGCAETGITTAASMRVEVEVYKGPLSKTPEAQWGEFTGIINEVSDALTTYDDSLVGVAVNLGYLTGGNDPKNHNKLTIKPHYRSDKQPELPTSGRKLTDTRSVAAVGNISIDKADWCEEPYIKNSSRALLPTGLLGCTFLAEMHDDVRELLETTARVRRLMGTSGPKGVVNNLGKAIEALNKLAPYIDETSELSFRNIKGMAQNAQISINSSARNIRNLQFELEKIKSLSNTIAKSQNLSKSKRDNIQNSLVSLGRIDSIIQNSLNGLENVLQGTSDIHLEIAPILNVENSNVPPETSRQLFRSIREHFTAARESANIYENQLHELKDITKKMAKALKPVREDADRGNAIAELHKQIAEAIRNGTKLTGLLRPRGNSLTALKSELDNAMSSATTLSTVTDIARGRTELGNLRSRIQRAKRINDSSVRKIQAKVETALAGFKSSAAFAGKAATDADLKGLLLSLEKRFADLQARIGDTESLSTELDNILNAVNAAGPTLQSPKEDTATLNRANQGISRAKTAANDIKPSTHAAAIKTVDDRLGTMIATLDAILELRNAPAENIKSLKDLFFDAKSLADNAKTPAEVETELLAKVDGNFTAIGGFLNAVFFDATNLTPAEAYPRLDDFKGRVQNLALYLQALGPTKATIGQVTRQIGEIRKQLATVKPEGALAKEAAKLDKVKAAVVAARTSLSADGLNLSVDPAQIDNIKRQLNEIQPNPTTPALVYQAPAAVNSAALIRLREDAHGWELDLGRYADLVNARNTAIASLSASVAAISKELTAAGSSAIASDTARIDLDNLKKLEGLINKLSSELKPITEKTSPPRGDAYYKAVLTEATALATEMNAKAIYWANAHVPSAPRDRLVRIVMASFGTTVSEYGNQIGSRADALLAQLVHEEKRKQMPTSTYLRDSQSTDFLNQYIWNRAVAPAILEDMILNPYDSFSSRETADRVRGIERLFTNKNWTNVNTVYASGQGDVAMALIKDDIGNWNLKSFDSDPTELLDAYKDLSLAGIKVATQALTAGSQPAGAIGVALDAASRLTRGRIASGGVTGGLDISRVRARTEARLEALQNEARTEREAGLENYQDADSMVESLTTASDTAETKALEEERQAGLLPDQDPPVTPAAATAGQAAADLTAASNNAEAARTIATRTKVEAGRLGDNENAKAAVASADAANGHASKTEVSVIEAGELADPPTAAQLISVGAAKRRGEAALGRANAAKAKLDLAKQEVAREAAATALRSQRENTIAEARDILDDYAEIILVFQDAASSGQPATGGSGIGGGNGNQVRLPAVPPSIPPLPGDSIGQ